MIRSRPRLRRFVWVGVAVGLCALAAPPAEARHRSHYAPRISWGWGGPWGGGYWGGYWGDPWVRGWSATTVYPTPGAQYGAIDFDVSPERAEIYVDGERVGLADDLDGFPDFLWLDKGTYDIVVYLSGYRTIAHQVSIYPGLIVDVDDRMEEGESVRPEDLASRSTERRDERVRRDRETAAALEGDGSRASRRTPAARGESDDASSLDARAEPAMLRLSVVPDDASVYLDGRFLGTGVELGRLRARLWIDAGEHRLEIVRPGYESNETRFSAASGEEVDLTIELVEALAEE